MGPALQKAGWLAAALCFFLGWSLLLAGETQSRRWDREVQYRYPQPQFTPLQLEELEVQDRLSHHPVQSLAAWGLGGEETASANGRELSVTPLLCYGEMELLVKSRLLPSGSDAREGWPAPWDREGCVIGSGLAEELFGSHQVVGLELELSGRTLQIRGVAQELGTAVLLYPPPGEEQPVFSSLVLLLPPGQDPHQAAEEFRLRHSLPGGAVTLLGFSAPLRMLAVLPPLALGLMLLAGLRRRCGLAGWRLALCLLAEAAALLWIGGLGLSIPQRMLPTRWSDFEFWGSLLHQELQRLLLLATAQKGLADAVWVSLLLRQMAGAVLALLSLWAMVRWRGQAPGGWLCCGLAVLAAAMAGLLLALALTGTAQADRAYWLFPLLLLPLWSGQPSTP